uniref:Methylcytosine dioxygenase TET n=1 Tax=Ceratitis capitata TaxID=7213 RepID=W8ANR5_CERCA
MSDALTAPLIPQLQEMQQQQQHNGPSANASGAQQWYSNPWYANQQYQQQYSQYYQYYMRYGLQQQQQQQQQQQMQGLQTTSNTGLTPGHSTLAPEAIGGGGDQIWKPHHTNSFKKPVANSFPTPEHHHQHQQHTTISHHGGHTTIAHTDAPPKKSSRKSKSRAAAAAEAAEHEKNSNDPGGGLHGSLHGSHSLKSLEKTGYAPTHGYPPPQHPDYHTPYIKTEPGLLPAQHTKMEGYERNYQNFIQYADFCQNEVQGMPSQQQHHQSQQDYASYHNSPYYGSSSSFQQSYQQNFVPGYQHSSAGMGYGSTHGMHPHHSSSLGHASHLKASNGPLMKSSSGAGLHHHNNHLMDIDRKPDTNSIIPLPTNYEKDIPAHAYPIPPHRYPLGPTPTHLGHTMIEPKIEDMGVLSHNPSYPFLGEGGSAVIKGASGFSCCRQGSTRAPTAEHLKDGTCTGIQTKDEIMDEPIEEPEVHSGAKPKKKGAKQEDNEIVVKHEKINPMFDTSDRLEKGNKTEIPECECFHSDKNPPEPGTYYTHLGTASTLAELRREFEERCQISGRQLRIEKIIYTGKEGKTTQGCPLAKWVIRRADPEEKILVVVKKRPGHRCTAAFIIVCMVAWDGMPRLEADNAYKNLIPKLNKFGLPTTRRCATNESRTCACQGLDPETSAASYSFGCSWSMYYNGCKYARSKTVRKFRLSVKSEESAIEDHMNLLATVLAPLFKQVCPRSYDNQTKYEKEATDCRLGLETGRPFSGVTACLDFCAHAHRDLHNMQDGCTVQVALLKPSNRDGRPPDDEQLHVLPLYTMDATDEFESMEGQREKHRTGAVQVLDKFPCEVRVRSTPLIPCRRHGKKRKEDETPAPEAEAAAATTATTPTTPSPAATTQSTTNTAANNANTGNGNNGAANLTNSNATTVATVNAVNGKKEGGVGNSKSKSKSKAGTVVNTAGTTPSSAPPSTPSPRCQTPVTNNPSPAGSAFTTPPVNNTNNTHMNTAVNNAAGGNAPNQLMSSNSSLMNMATMIDTFTDAQLQSNQISSTVLDSPYSYDYQTGSYIDSRNYYGNWPPPHATHATHPVGMGPGAPGTAATPMAPPQGNVHHTTTAMPTAAAPLTPHHDTNTTYGNNYNNLPTAGSQQLTQVHDVRGEVKSRGSEENPDSTTIVNNTLAEKGFVKPKPPADYQYTQYPSNYQMYPPPHSAYSAYDAYQNMNYNYGYHQAYSPYSMYPQQTPPPTPPPPSPNWNMYGHHQNSASTAAYATTVLPSNGGTHQHSSLATSIPQAQAQMPLTNGNLKNVLPMPVIQPTPPADPQQQQMQQQVQVQTPLPVQTQLPMAQPQTVLPDLSNTNAPIQATQLNTELTNTNPTIVPNVTSPIANTAVATSMAAINNDSSNNSTSNSNDNGSPTATTCSSAENGTAGNGTTANTSTTTTGTTTTATAVATTSNPNKLEPIGEVTEINDNYEAFADPQMGGVAIALNHGSVLIECAKHELHATTALRNPNRHEPTRMTLIFYQHRNLNRPRHGIDEWEEKMRVKKINTDLDNKAKEEREKQLKKERDGEDGEEEEENAEGTLTNGSTVQGSKKDGNSNVPNGNSNGSAASAETTPTAPTSGATTAAIPAAATTAKSNGSSGGSASKKKKDSGKKRAGVGGNGGAGGESCAPRANINHNLLDDPLSYAPVCGYGTLPGGQH